MKKEGDNRSKSSEDEKAGKKTGQPRRDLIDVFRGLESHNKFLFGLILIFGVVSFWRGAWIVMDMIIFPGNPLFSGVFCVLLGLTILSASGTLLRGLS